MSKPVIGADLGGTNIKVGLVDDVGKVLEQLSIPTPRPEEGSRAIPAAIAGAARQCVNAAGLTLDDVAGMGLGSPGPLDLEAGTVGHTPNLPSLRNAPLRDWAHEELGLPVVLENDANAAALAEHWVGAGRGHATLVLLTLGTGIGGGIILDGRVCHGGFGVAGEIGHMTIMVDGPPCECGSRGCLEQLASAPAMARRMRESIADGVETSLADRVETLTARDIHDAALAGDAAARENIEQTGRYLGAGIGNIMHILNPEVIALSGGPTAAGQMLLAPLIAEALERTFEESSRGVEIGFSRVPHDAGLIGAARCFMLARG